MGFPILLTPDPELFCEGGQRGGALIIMVWSWLEILRVKEEDVSGVWGEAQPLFTAIMLLRCVLVVFLSSGRRKTPLPVAMNI